jgi:hypothetical protein
MSELFNRLNETHGLYLRYGKGEAEERQCRHVKRTCRCLAERCWELHITRHQTLHIAHTYIFTQVVHSDDEGKFFYFNILNY